MHLKWKPSAAQSAGHMLCKWIHLTWPKAKYCHSYLILCQVIDNKLKEGLQNQKLVDFEFVIKEFCLFQSNRKYWLMQNIFPATLEACASTGREKAAKTKPVSSVWVPFCCSLVGRLQPSPLFPFRESDSPSESVTSFPSTTAVGPGWPRLELFSRAPTTGWRGATWWRRRGWRGRMFPAAVGRRKTVVWGRRMTPLKTHVTPPAAFLQALRCLGGSRWGFEAFKPSKSGAEGLCKWDTIKSVKLKILPFQKFQIIIKLEV